MSNLHVVCRIGALEYAIPAAEISVLESFSEVTAVPGAPAYVLGLVQVRQKIIPVIDARLRFGLEKIPVGPDSRLLVLRVGTREVGLVVDSAREVRNFSPEEFYAAPDLLANGSTRFVRSVANLKDRIIMLIDTAQVIGEENAHG